MDCLTLKRHNILIKTQNRVLSMLVKQHCTLERGTRRRNFGIALVPKRG